MRLSEIIMERATGILYHGTTYENAASIVKQGVFLLSDADGDDKQSRLMRHKKFPYYLSTSRLKNGSFCLGTYKCSVMFVLDGEWVNKNPKLRTYPVDADQIWWGSKNHMAEDRIWSRKAMIPIEGLVKEIHMIFSHRINAMERRAANIFEKSGIPIYFYHDEDYRDFKILNKRKATRKT